MASSTASASSVRKGKSEQEQLGEEMEKKNEMSKASWKFSRPKVDKSPSEEGLDEIMGRLFTGPEEVIGNIKVDGSSNEEIGIMKPFKLVGDDGRWIVGSNFYLVDKENKIRLVKTFGFDIDLKERIVVPSDEPFDFEF